MQIIGRIMIEIMIGKKNLINGQNFFYKMRFINNYIFHYNLSQSEATDMKFGECMQKQIKKNLQGAKF